MSLGMLPLQPIRTATRRTLLRLRADERGIGMVEVIVSALLVVLVGSGVYLGLDAASATSGINKHRSVATYVAQQDQDRMRAMAVAELSNYRDTQTSTVGGILYTTNSRASWVTDGTGAASCTSGTAQANYLSVTSSVTWPSMKIPPVTLESVIAPPNGSFGPGQGSLAVQVRDRNGVGVPGVSVTLTGAQGFTDATNSAGCVIWGYLPVGSYTVSVAKSGYVDASGVALPSQPAGVVGEATTTLAFDYDLGGRIQANYQTDSGAGVVPANGTIFTAITSHLTVPLAPFGDGAPHTSFTSPVVFPFTDPYGVYAGSCAGADPAAQTPPVPSQLAQVTPGGVVTVAVREPSINLKVVRGATADAGAIVKLTGTGAGCGALPARTTGADGYVTDRAFPYGPYNVCVQDTDTSGKIWKKTGTVTNNTPGGVPVASATYDMATGAVLGTCP